MSFYDIAPNVTVCTGPEMREDSRKIESTNTWCFTCRKRVTFWRVSSFPADWGVDMSIASAFYGPDVNIECENGHIDGDCGFGSYRTWGEW